MPARDIQVTGALPSGDRWTFATDSRERAEEECRQMREYLSGVQIIAAGDNERSDHRQHSVSGIDAQGDLWVFSSQDRERAKAALAYFDGYQDVTLSEVPCSSVSERVLWGG